MSKKKLAITLMLSMTLCCAIVLSTLFACIFAPNQLVASTNNVSSPAFNIYFVSTSKSAFEAESAQRGKDVMNQDLSGYVWEYENYFHVISSAYKNENDATLVKNKIVSDGGTAETISVSFPAIKISYPFSQDEKLVMNAALSSFKECYDKLFDISISLDTGVYNETAAMLAINNTLSTFSATEKNFSTLFAEQDSETINSIGEYLTCANESLSLLSNKTFITQSQTLSSLIKYRYCELLHLYYNLLIELK